VIQVELHDRTNALVKVLGGAKNAAFQVQLNSDGAGSFLIHRSDPDVAALGILSGGIQGFIVHLLRKGPLEAAFTDRFAFQVESVVAGVDQGEDQTAWYTVAGRGTLSLLEDRIAYPPGYDGVTQSTVTSQWQIYTAKPGGQIMGGEIARTSGRFALPLTHSVDTTTVPQTVTLRFDNLRKLHDYLVGNGMDAQMVGLDYQAADNLGTDKSASVTVQLSGQDSVLGVNLQLDSRPVKNYVVAQGTGEGINAKLRSSSDAPSIAAFRRREGFLDASQDADPTQLALRASSAVKQLKTANQRITVSFFDSTATQLYRDFGLGDTITLNVQPLSILAPYRVVGFSVADTDAEIEAIALDLNDMRQEYLVKLATGAQLTADQLNTIARMPQGAPYNDSFGFPDSADGTHPWRVKRFIPSNLLQLNYCKLSFSFGAFRAPVAGASTVTSGASSAASSSSGSSHTHTTPAHGHIVAGFVNGVGMGATAHEYSMYDSSGFTVNLDIYTPSNLDLYTYTTSGSATSGSEGSHSHLIPHTHTVTPQLIYGIFEGTTASAIKVLVNGVDRTVALGGAAGGFTVDQAELEISQWLTVGAWNTFELQPDVLGRIYADVRMTGYIQSA
jgi:hypothetical protein